MNLVKVYNQGRLTDYLTDSDELEIKIGVGDSFVFSFVGEFREGQDWSFSDSVIFPCYSDDTVFIQMTEFDDYHNDETLVSVDCSSLQLGSVGLEVVISENSGVATQSAQVVKSVFGWTYQWFGPMGEVMDTVATGDGKYIFDFDVTQPCKEIKLDDAQIYPPVASKLQVQSLSSIDAKIREEVTAPAPQMFGADGATLVRS